MAFCVPGRGGDGGVMRARGGGGGSFAACLRHLTVDHGSLSRRSGVGGVMRGDGGRGRGSPTSRRASGRGCCS